jgi:PAS domain S-box-containing protein
MQSSNCRILLVDDEEGIRFTIGSLLQREGYEVDAAACHIDAIICLQSAHYDLAFVDIMLAGDSGINLLQDIKTISPTTQVIMITGYPQVGSAAAAVRLGAFDYITKPVRQETLLLVTRHALTAKQTNDKLEQYRANMNAIFRTVSDSIIMVDKTGCLAHFNAMAEKACGYSKDLIGSNVATIRPGCDGFCITTLLETLTYKAPREIRRHECFSPEGKSRIVSLTATPVIEMDGSVGGAVAVIRDETILVELERALHKQGQFQGIVGASSPMQRVYALIEALANVPTTVLICGESGTGKELVAKALHFSGSRVAGPLVKVNCSALSESLLESELFGHVRGAFTGAIADKVGRFQKADGGTLFLDKIGDISLPVQMRLLRVLQEHEFERVGESTPIKVDVRVIAATNQNLLEKVRQGIFREDLYYRLNVVQLTVPALRERLADLDLLVAHFIAKFNNRLGREIQGVSDEVIRVFRCHAWPGNVRELEHVIECAIILCKSDIISVRDLPQDLIDSVLDHVDSTSENPLPSLPTPKKNISLEEALEMSGGNKTRAAKLLGVSRLTVYRHIKKNEPM